MIRIRFGLAAMLLLALIAPARIAAAQEEPLHPYFDSEIIEHFDTGTIRVFGLTGAERNNLAAATLVVLDDDEAAARFIDLLTAWLGTGSGIETVPLDLPGLPGEGEAEALLMQTIPGSSDPKYVNAYGAIRIGNVVLNVEAMMFDGTSSAAIIVPLFEVFIQNALAADDDEDDPETFLPAVDQLPTGYSQTSEDEPLKLKERDA